MNAKRKSSVNTSLSSDDAPEITDEWISGADLYKGRRLVRRGRPKLASPRKLLSLRLPPEVIANWKASGPGWQTRMAQVIEKANPRGKRTLG